jgi:hypothetical protein
MEKVETDDDLQVGKELSSLRVRSKSMSVNRARLSAESHYQVAIEINQKSAVSSLSRPEVFEEEYEIK